MNKTLHVCSEIAMYIAEKVWPKICEVTVTPCSHQFILESNGCAKFEEIPSDNMKT